MCISAKNRGPNNTHFSGYFTVLRLQLLTTIVRCSCSFLSFHIRSCVIKMFIKKKKICSLRRCRYCCCRFPLFFVQNLNQFFMWLSVWGVREKSLKKNNRNKVKNFSFATKKQQELLFFPKSTSFIVLFLLLLLPTYDNMNMFRCVYF